MSGCERLDDLIDDFISDRNISYLDQRDAKPSAEQNQKIQQLYRALQSKQQAVLRPLLDKHLQQQLVQSPEILRHIFSLVPSQTPESHQFLTMLKSRTHPIGRTTSIVTVFEHPQQVLALTTVFEGHDGRDALLAFTIDLLEKSEVTSNDSLKQ